MRKTRWFSKFSLLIIVLVAVIVFVTYIAVSYLSYHALAQQERQSIIMYHERLSSYINEQVNDIGIATLLYVSRNISMGALGEIEDDVDKKTSLMKDIQVLIEANRGINSIYFYSGIEQLVMYYSAGAITILPFDDFFDMSLYYDFLAKSRYTYLSGYRTMPTNYRTVNRTLPGAQTTVASEIKRLPLRGHTRDVIVVNIEESFFRNLISSSNLPTSSIMLVTDAEGGSVITYYADPEHPQLTDVDLLTLHEQAYADGTLRQSFDHTLAGERFFVSAALHSRDRIYYTLVPEGSLSPGYSQVNLVMILVELAILGVGVWVASFLSNTLTRPLGSMIGRLSGEDEAGPYKPIISYPLLHEIDRHIDRALAQRREHEATMASYFHSYKEGVLLSILHGSLRSNPVPKDVFAFAEGDATFMMVLCCLPSGDEEGRSRAAWDEYIRQVAQDLSAAAHVDSVPLSPARTAFVLTLERDLPDPTEGLRHVLMEASRLCPFERPPVFLVGTPCMDMEELSLSYRCAEALFSGMPPPEDNVVLLSALEEASPHSLYMTVLRQQDVVVQAVHGGEMNRAVMEIDSLFALMQGADFTPERIGRHCLSLIAYLEAGMTRDGSAPPVPSPADLLREAPDPEAMRGWVTQRILRMLPAEGKRDGADPKNRELIERVLSFIADHYPEDISLTTIADYVYFTPQYLGKLFREATGMTFTNYLIKVRMEGASTLLLSTRHPVALIAQLVGYTNVQSFGRTFKGYFSLTPGEFRRQNRLNP